MIQRGDVVLVDFPFTDSAVAKVRPALIVQSDRNNRQLRKTIVAMITGNVKRRGDPSHVWVDPSAPVGAGSGLHGASLVSCINLYTVEQDSIISKLGHLSDVLLQQVTDSLKTTLDLP